MSGAGFPASAIAAAAKAPNADYLTAHSTPSARSAQSIDRLGRSELAVSEVGRRDGHVTLAAPDRSYQQAPDQRACGCCSPA